ncbi:MAG: HD domain-containing protein [Lachnospiraceae bacterium]|nr:HD domain-containing protein [Lachnospiraceae bacterium]
MREELKNYVENTEKIRMLTSAKLKDIAAADDYGMVLQDNYLLISRLAAENREILSKCFYPYLSPDAVLDDDVIESFGQLEDSLQDSKKIDHLDPFMHAKLSGVILNQTEKKNASVDELILQLDREVTSCYFMVFITKKIYNRPDISEYYRQRGLKAGKKLLEYLPPENFDALGKDSKHIVIVNSRYVTVLYEGRCLTREERDWLIDRLSKSLELSEDPYYLREMPGYDWKLHVERVYYYYALILDQDNEAGFDPDQLKHICKRMKELDELWHADRQWYSTQMDENMMRFLLLRAEHLSGELTGREYRNELLKMYEQRNVRSEKDWDDLALFLWVPTDYILSLKNERLSEKDKYYIERFYLNTLDYAHQSSGSLVNSDLLDCLSKQMYDFIEIPGGKEFESMGLGYLAAVHTPTYVHSIMVGQIARCLAGHLLKKGSHLFDGIDPSGNPQEILSFIYNAGLCHDFGKIMLADTMTVYGRNLLDEEYDLLKEHAELGACMLEKHSTTVKYAKVARYHHLWYDGSDGYPKADISALPEKAVIDIIACADGLDAATDRVGRSYSKGKTLEEFTEELKAGAGTRYAPYLVELFEDEAVRKDIEYLMQQGRRDSYSRAYQRIRDFTEQSILYGENL